MLFITLIIIYGVLHILPFKDIKSLVVSDIPKHKQLLWKSRMCRIRIVRLDLDLFKALRVANYNFMFEKLSLTNRVGGQSTKCNASSFSSTAGLSCWVQIETLLVAYSGFVQCGKCNAIFSISDFPLAFYDNDLIREMRSVCLTVIVLRNKI